MKRLTLLLLCLLLVTACENSDTPPNPNPDPTPIPSPTPEPNPVPEPTPNPEPTPDGPSGTIDETFGNKGKVIFDTGNVESARDLLLQRDGTLVVVGQKDDGTSAFSSEALVIFFNPDGTVKKNVFFQGESPHTATVTSDDHIVIVGQTDPTDDGVDNRVVYVRRLKPDGTSDESFGSGGIVFTTLIIFPAGFIPNDVVVDDQDRVVIGGTKNVGDDSSAHAFQLVRLSSNGSLDPSFGTGGIVTTQMKFDDQLLDLALDTEERIIAVGRTRAQFGKSSFVAVRHTNNGDLDTSFGPFGQGFSVVEIAPNTDGVAFSVALDSQGRILLAGDAQETGSKKLALVRFDSNGF
jgi:uncharacterized delta-60 repeat protein